MKQIRSAARVARKVQQTEAAIDQSILETTALIAGIIEASREGHLAAEVGQGAIANMIVGLQAMATARGAIANGHADLAQVADDLAIQWRMDGPLVQKIKGATVPFDMAKDAA